MLGGFLWLEAKRGERAIMPFALFATAIFIGLTLLTFFLYAGLGGLLVLLPYLLIRIEGYSALAAGAAMLPLPILIRLGSPLMGRLTGRYGGRLLLAVGAGVVAAGSRSIVTLKRAASTTGPTFCRGQAEDAAHRLATDCRADGAPATGDSLADLTPEWSAHRR